MESTRDSEILILKAADFAARKHRTQRRKDPEASPYINHPIAVARILAEVGGVTDPEVLAAALLHDTIEDTETTPEEIDAEFGARVAQMVVEVSDDRSLPKAERKRLQQEHAAHLSDGAALVKLGDKIANVSDIADHPPDGWSIDRRIEYLDWAEGVIANCPDVSETLLASFEAALANGRAMIGPGD